MMHREISDLKTELAAEAAARAAAESEVKQLQQQVVTLHAKLDSNVATASEDNGMVAGRETELEAVRATLTSATMGTEHRAQQRKLDEVKSDVAEACQQALDLAE
ncbi:unnamed protein product, partial [Prorocentrum cordatum]